MTEEGVQVGVVEGEGVRGERQEQGERKEQGDRLVKVRVEEDGGRSGWRVVYEGEVGRGRVHADTQDRLQWQLHVQRNDAISIQHIADAMRPAQPDPAAPPLAATTADLDMT